MLRIASIVILAVVAIQQCLCVDNGLGRTPALGYNTWNDFRCSGITADHVKQVTDKIVALGLAKVGYEYVNIDDCWATTRDSQGRLVADPNAFPQGVKALSDYVHSKGLKLGIYTDRGTKTCAGRPASQGYEKIDAQTFADWGIDYLKEDSCNADQDHQTAFNQYGLMRDALNATGRPIYFSLCGWNSWYAQEGWNLGNSWRIASDCNGWDTIYNAIRVNEQLTPYARPGGWNDPDMLVGSSPAAAVHNTPDQARTQFSLWAIMAAPLLIGSNILNISAYDLETYSNTEVLAVDQDPLGIQGSVIRSNCPSYDSWLESKRTVADIPSCQQIWARRLANGDHAINMVNFGTTPATITCDTLCLRQLGYTAVNVRDLWAHKDLGRSSSISVNVGANGASVTVRVSAA